MTALAASISTAPAADPRRKLAGDAADTRKFIAGGNAIFTVRNNATGNRFTYKVTFKRDADGNKITPMFVSVLTGPDNTGSYSILGTVFDDGNYVWNRNKSRIKRDAMSNKAFAWLWARINGGHALPDTVEFWHEGRCCVCARKLTVPESIESGIGPICAGRL